MKGENACGACYEIKCTENPSCSGQSIRVVVADSCLGCLPTNGNAHFDLSGTAFGAMAKPGQEQQLRHAGTFNMQYQRANCDYSDTKIGFRVDQGSNSHYFAVLIEFVEGEGALAMVSLKEGNSDGWLDMVRSMGAVWKLEPGRELHPPFSIRVVSHTNKELVADNVIPSGWQPGATYMSMINYL